jgi:hypothetical protein
LKIWNDEILLIVDNKNQACLKYLNAGSEEDKLEYKRRCAVAKRECKKLRRESWDRYVSNSESDVHGIQVKTYKIMQHLNKTKIYS